MKKRAKPPELRFFFRNNNNKNIFSSIPLICLLCLLSLVTCLAQSYTDCSYISENVVTCNGTNYGEDQHEPFGTPRFWIDTAVIASLVLVAGLMSGLTIGLLSLDKQTIQILCKAGEAEQKRYAEKILPLVSRHHLLLVTLLLCNAAAMEALPIFLDQLVSPTLAIIISVSFVLLFGEVIPQALCSRYGLAIGAFFAPIVWVLIALCFVIAWPISKILDFCVGQSDSSMFRRSELKELVAIHSTEAQGPLTLDEVKIMKGALDLKEKTAKDAMTSIDTVFALSIDTLLTAETLALIKKNGHSRIPIYRNNVQNIAGFLLVKSLIGLDPKSNTPISALPVKKLPILSSKMPLYDIFNILKNGKSHMGVVQDENDFLTVVGIITLEDIIEELIQGEIIDEADLIRLREKMKTHEELTKEMSNLTRRSTSSGSNQQAKKGIQ